MFQTVNEVRSNLFFIGMLSAVALIFGFSAFVYFTQDKFEDKLPIEGIIRFKSLDFEHYGAQLVFEDRGIQMLKNFAGHRMVLFNGSITNHCDFPLDVLEVRLILFNAHEPVFEIFRKPIRPGGYTPPVLTGETRKFTLYLEDFPKNWLASRAEMDISGFRFSGVTSKTPVTITDPISLSF